MKVKVNLTDAAKNQRAIEVTVLRGGISYGETVGLEAAKEAVKDLRAAIRAVEGRRK